MEPAAGRNHETGGEGEENEGSVGGEDVPRDEPRTPFGAWEDDNEVEEETQEQQADAGERVDNLERQLGTIKDNLSSLTLLVRELIAKKHADEPSSSTPTNKMVPTSTSARSKRRASKSGDGGGGGESDGYDSDGSSSSSSSDKEVKRRAKGFSMPKTFPKLEDNMTDQDLKGLKLQLKQFALMTENFDTTKLEALLQPTSYHGDAIPIKHAADADRAELLEQLSLLPTRGGSRNQRADRKRLCQQIQDLQRATYNMMCDLLDESVVQENQQTRIERASRISMRDAKEKYQDIRFSDYLIHFRGLVASCDFPTNHQVVLFKRGLPETLAYQLFLRIPQRDRSDLRVIMQEFRGRELDFKANSAVWTEHLKELKAMRFDRSSFLATRPQDNKETSKAESHALVAYNES
ncbi:MAG: hypothetical protein AAF802_22265, partial [Planctomycetota bacterium]